MKQQLIKLSKNTEDAGFQSRKIGPIEFVDVYVMRLAADGYAFSFQPDRLVGVLRIVAAIAHQLALHELRVEVSFLDFNSRCRFLRGFRLRLLFALFSRSHLVKTLLHPRIKRAAHAFCFSVCGLRAHHNRVHVDSQALLMERKIPRAFRSRIGAFRMLLCRIAFFSRKFLQHIANGACSFKRLLVAHPVYRDNDGRTSLCGYIRICSHTFFTSVAENRWMSFSMITRRRSLSTFLLLLSASACRGRVFTRSGDGAAILALCCCLRLSRCASIFCFRTFIFCRSERSERGKNGGRRVSLLHHHRPCRIIKLKVLDCT